MNDYEVIFLVVMLITSCTIEYSLYIFERILSWKWLIDTLFVQFISDELFQFFDHRFDGATLVIPIDDTANMFVLQLTLNKGVEEIFFGTNSMNKEIEICIEIEFHFVVKLLGLLVNENIFRGYISFTLNDRRFKPRKIGL